MSSGFGLNGFEGRCVCFMSTFASSFWLHALTCQVVVRAGATSSGVMFNLCVSLCQLFFSQ